ncbi:MAG: HIT domain-containing protein [Vampirovibrionales bacterium]
MRLIPSVRFSKIEYPVLPESGSIFTRIANREFAEKNGYAPIFQNEKAYVILDGFPVSQGHALVVPKREVPRSQDLNSDERLAMWDLVEQTKEKLLQVYPAITGFNVGWNDGIGAGQTIGHLHIHVIPRYKNDLPNYMTPVGGIRGVLMDPNKKDYHSDLGKKLYYSPENYEQRVQSIHKPFDEVG